MSVTVKVELYSGKIQQLQKITQQSFEMTVEAVLTDIRMSQTVPKDTGELERSGFTAVENMVARIIFDTPYARKLYWHPEYNFRQDKNQLAGGLWLQTYIDGEKRNFVKDTYGIFLKQLGGSLIT